MSKIHSRSAFFETQTAQANLSDEIEKRLSEILIFEATTDLVLICDLNGNLLYINRAARKIFSISKQTVIAELKLLDFYPIAEHQRINEAIFSNALTEGIWNGETTMLIAHGATIPVSQVVIAHKDSHERVEFISIVARDISEIRSAEKAIQIFARIFESTQEGIMITDDKRQILSVNPAFTRLTGYAKEEVLGKDPRILQSGKHDRVFYQTFWESLQQKGQWQGEIWNRRKCGEIYPEWLTINAIKDEHSVVTNYVAVFSDITSIKASESRLAHLAHHDPLTGLPNRMLFQDRLNQAMAQSSRNTNNVAVLYLDLDQFKPVNDELGHHVGDLLLQAVAERLRGCVREEDTAARLGGDEFSLVLSNIANRLDAARVAQKVLDALLQPFVIQGYKLNIGCSIGISMFPEDTINMNELIQMADCAMYRAKQSGGKNYQFIKAER